MLLSASAYLRVVMGKMVEMGMLMEKARSLNEEEREQARKQIVEELTKKERYICDICQHIAEMYAFAMSALEMRDWQTVAKALSRARELRQDLERACEEERELREKFWEVLTEVR